MPEIAKMVWQYNLLHMGHVEMINGREQINFDRVHVEKIVIFIVFFSNFRYVYNLFCIYSAY